MGRLADGARQRAVIVVTLSVVLAGCVLSAVATSFAVLVLGRALQGVGLGLLPVNMAIARRNLDRRPGRTGHRHPVGVHGHRRRPRLPDHRDGGPAARRPRRLLVRRPHGGVRPGLPRWSCCRPGRRRPGSRSTCSAPSCSAWPSPASRWCSARAAAGDGPRPRSLGLVVASVVAPGRLGPPRAALGPPAGQPPPPGQPLGAHGRRRRLPHERVDVPGRPHRRRVHPDPPVGRVRLRRLGDRVRASSSPRCRSAPSWPAASSSPTSGASGCAA